ncbi:MAG: hypothetical protein QMB24_18565 [Spirosomataceae bacterium]|jgi:hypothetical protein
MENFIFLLKLFIHKTAKMLSDQLIISGIRIGGTRENEAIQAIYDNFSYTLQKFISLKQEESNAAIIWEAVECFVNGVKNDLIVPSPKDGTGVEFYLNRIGQKIKYPEKLAIPEVEKLFEDKAVWDYYLGILKDTEGSGNQLLTRSFGKGTPVKELAGKLVAKGKYNSVETVKSEKYKLLTDILPNL